MKKASRRPIDVFKGAKTTGELIKAYRENFEIRQDDMAHACKISQGNLSAIEQGRREVGARLALRLAAFMGVSPDLVLYPSGYESEPEYLEVRERSAEYSTGAARVPQRNR
ncbi:MAG: helix-turn-helix transcriptional regulator [Bdellovibrionota bacterium]